MNTFMVAPLLVSRSASASVSSRVSGSGGQSIAERFGQFLEVAGTRELLLCAGNDHVRVQRELPGLCAELERRLPENLQQLPVVSLAKRDRHTRRLRQQPRR